MRRLQTVPPHGETIGDTSVRGPPVCDGKRARMAPAETDFLFINAGIELGI